jgi:hypothetical protein
MSNENKRFIGKIVENEYNGEVFYSIIFDNPYPTKKDSDEPDPYHKGELLWFDKKTGKYFQVLGLALRNPPPKCGSLKVVNSLMLDLDKKIHVKEIKE